MYTVHHTEHVIYNTHHIKNIPRMYKKTPRTNVISVHIDIIALS